MQQEIDTQERKRSENKSLFLNKSMKLIAISNLIKKDILLIMRNKKGNITTDSTLIKIIKILR